MSKKKKYRLRRHSDFDSTRHERGYLIKTYVLDEHEAVMDLFGELLNGPGAVEMWQDLHSGSRSFKKV